MLPRTVARPRRIVCEVVKPPSATQGCERGRVRRTKIEIFKMCVVPIKMENVELSNCIYEHIKDTFYYGLFGDFRLVIDKSTGFFNATKLCDQGSKNLFNWKRLEKSKRMIEYYQRSCPSDLKGSFLYEVKLQNNDNLNKQITGTYVPQELILEIASWVSIEFYDKCNKIILNYFVNEFKKMNKSALEEKIKQVEQLEEQMKKLTLKHEEVVAVKDDKIDQLLDYVRSLGISLEHVKDQNDELLDRNKSLKSDIKQVKTKLNIAVEDRAPLPENKAKQERFVLLKRNDDEYYPYYTIRAQDDYTKRELKFERQHFPNLEILLDFACNPNSKTLYTRIKESLKAKRVVFKGNNIDLESSDVTEQQLMDEMIMINDAKREVC